MLLWLANNVLEEKNGEFLQENYKIKSLDNNYQTLFSHFLM